MTPALRWVFLGIAGIVLGPKLPADSPSLATAPIVRLPQYTVTDTAVGPDREIWRYLAIPGYEIIAQIPDPATTLLAKDITQFGQLLQRILPAIANTRLESSRLILCTQRADFERFIPASVRAELPVEQVNRLFLGDQSHPVIVLYFNAKATGDAYDVELARAYAANRLQTQFPPLPAWYIEGLSRIYAAAEITYRNHLQGVLVGHLDARPPPKVLVQDSSGVSSQDFTAEAPRVPLTTDVARIVQGDILEVAVTAAIAAGASSPTDPDDHLIGFKRYFLDGSRPFPHLAELFAGPTASNYEDWCQGCGLFVHYCLFSFERRTYFPALERFFKILPTAPDADPTAAFQAAFGTPYRAIEEKIGYYVVSPDYRANKYSFPETDPTIPALREATDAEVSDVKSQAYLAAGNPALGYAELIAAYKHEKASGTLEPRMLAALGVWEAEHGEASRAEPLIAAAVAAQDPEARLYLAIARQRLAQIGSGRPLSAAETQGCLEALTVAREVAKPDLAGYRLGAEIWARSSARPNPAELANLALGVKRFPHDQMLNYATAKAYLRLGQAADARRLIQRGIAYGDPAARASFAGLLAGGSAGSQNAGGAPPSPPDVPRQ